MSSALSFTQWDGFEKMRCEGLASGRAWNRGWTEAGLESSLPCRVAVTRSAKAWAVILAVPAAYDIFLGLPRSGMVVYIMALGTKGIGLTGLAQCWLVASKEIG